MQQDRFISLVTKKLSGSITQQEQAELSEWLCVPENARYFDYLSRFWNKNEHTAEPDVEKALSKVLLQINETEEAQPLIIKRKKKRLALYVTVPLLVLIAGLSYIFYTKQESGLVQQSQVAMQLSEITADSIGKRNLKGTRSVIVLADGSRVWLNADSKLSYPKVFNEDFREVQLTGEAFFDIAKNKQKPFIIHLPDGMVKVLGTSFNIKAYEGDSIIETAVVTGEVAFIPKKRKAITQSADTTFLTKNHKAIYTVNTGKVETVKVIGEDEKAWTEGKLIFKSVPLGDIAKVLERSFGKEFSFDKEDITQYRITGSFENDKLEEILYYLSQLKPFTYRITETEVMVFELADKKP